MFTIIFFTLATMTIILAAMFLFDFAKDANEHAEGLPIGLLFLLLSFVLYAAGCSSMKRNMQEVHTVCDVQRVSIDTTYITSANQTDTIYTIHYWKL